MGSTPLENQPNVQLGEDSGAHFTSAFPTAVSGIKQAPSPAPALPSSQAGQSRACLAMCALQCGRQREHNADCQIVKQKDKGLGRAVERGSQSGSVVHGV